MLVGRLPLQRGSIAGCWIGVAKSMCSVMLKDGDDHMSQGNCVGGDRVLIISRGWRHYVIRIVCKHRISDLRSDLVWTRMLQVRGLWGLAMTICWMCESGLHPRSKQQCWALSPEFRDFPRLHKLPPFYAPWCLIGSLLLATFSYWGGFKPGGFSFWTSFSRV